MKKVFKFKAQVWKWPGFAGWHFVNLPKNISKQIKKTAKTYGAGFVKVKVIVGQSSWVTALFPHKESETYFLSVKSNIIKKEGIYENDKINITFTLT